MRVKTWDEFYGDPHTLTEMLRWSVTHAELVNAVVGSTRVLEVGTGTGMLSALVSRFCDRVVTLDNSAHILRTAGDFAGSVGAEVLSVRGDAFRLPCASDTFGACFSQGLLEHFGDDEAVALVGEQLRVAPLAYVSVPSVFYPHLGRRGPGLVGNERLLSLSRWRTILGRWPVTGRYYADFKVASVAGRTVPWPAQILLRVERG
ncbi:MAG: class I SAM-dependent methyltransferase [Actinomycetota bacterium]|nr:class I SAM-dependent methyltransferase [Actinomycetota bacterium]